MQHLHLKSAAVNSLYEVQAYLILWHGHHSFYFFDHVNTEQSSMMNLKVYRKKRQTVSGARPS